MVADEEAQVMSPATSFVLTPVAVEEGNVVWIETTGKPGFVNLRVRVGQEERLHTNQNRILPGIPEEGNPTPSGW